MKTIRLFGLLAASLSLSGAAASQPLREPTQAESVALGRSVVERNCAMCHAVGPSGASPNSAAPAFRGLSRRLDVEALGEGLAQGILTEHPAMPEFRLSPPEVIGVIRYLRSIQEKQRAVAAPQDGGRLYSELGAPSPADATPSTKVQRTSPGLRTGRM